ncbi:MAG TPA: hypothetical protein V6D04_11715, partial [Candidatus Obscuribacterales bacterium]
MKKFSFYIAFLCGLFLFLGMGLVQAYEPNVNPNAAIASDPILSLTAPTVTPPVQAPTGETPMSDRVVDQVENAATLAKSETFQIAASDEAAEEAEEESGLPDL